jgi:hypothetical protein
VIDASSAILITEPLMERLVNGKGDLSDSIVSVEDLKSWPPCIPNLEYGFLGDIVAGVSVHLAKGLSARIGLLVLIGRDKGFN